MLWLLLFSVFLGLFLWRYLTEEEDPLDKVPGPKKLPIVGNAFLFFNKDSHAVFELLRQCTREYGDRFVIKIFGRRLLHISNPADAEVILSHPKNITKNLIYQFMEPWLGTGILLSTGSTWHKRRRLLNPTFHYNILKNFSTVMVEKSRDLVERFKKTNGGTFDLFYNLSDVTLFTLCETAMGVQLNCDTSNTSEFKVAAEKLAGDIVTRVSKFWLHIGFIFKWSQIGRDFEKRLHTVHDFSDKVILERKKQMQDVQTEEIQEFGIKKRKVLLDLLLEDEMKGEIDLKGIRDEVNVFMVAGHDTTATALTFMLMLIAEHEDVQERIYEECKKIFGDSDRLPNMTDLGEMKYMEAAIKESLRLYPSAPAISRTITEEFYLGDLKVKKGSDVVVHIYDIHRRPDLYPDPERFNPDRFLNPEPRHAYAYVPFSAGPRNCIGQRFAMLEMKAVVSELLRAFKLMPVKRGNPRLKNDLSLKSVDPVLVNFVPRTSKYL